jgi:hypothetical protein
MVLNGDLWNHQHTLSPFLVARFAKMRVNHPRSFIVTGFVTQKNPTQRLLVLLFFLKKKGHTIKYCDRLKKKEQNHRGNQPAMRQQSDVRQQPVMRQQPGTGYEEGEIADDASTGTMSTMSEHDWPAVGDGRSFISTTF